MQVAFEVVMVVVAVVVAVVVMVVAIKTRCSSCESRYTRGEPRTSEVSERADPRGLMTEGKPLE